MAESAATRSRALEAALGTFPLVRVNGKAPIDAEWTTGPRTDPVRWRRKLERWRGNLGILTGELATGEFLVVVDVDLEVHGAEDSWDRLRELGLTVYTVTTITPRGRHYYYRSAVAIPSRPLDNFRGIDIKCTGGQVVIPPSVHPDTGTEYQWEEGWRPGDCELVALPAPVLQLLGGSERAREHRVLDERDEQAVALLLEHFGGHSPVVRDDHVEVTRPGKERGSSATVGVLGPGAVKVWSSNWPGLAADVYSLSKLRARAGVKGPTITIPDAAPTRATPSLAELLDDGEPEYEWRIPNLFERGDRFVITGKEGFGKSTLLRQIGLGAALGLNTLSSDPLTRTHEPLRVLLVDLENSRRQLRREFTKALRAVDDDRRRALTERLYVESHPEGLVLDLARDPDGDREWLTEVVAATRPELLIVGPIYKMIIGDASEEAPNRELVKWLDRLRGDHDLVLCLEAHTPHDANRPYGWSGWKRWPEFGLHLHEDGRLEHWRAQREERPWPERLARGRSDAEAPEWLWIPAPGTAGAPPSDRHEDLIAQCELEVLRALRRAPAPRAASELVELVGRRRASVLAAIARLRDRGAFIVTVDDRRRSDGQRYEVEAYAIDPSGPFRGPE